MEVVAEELSLSPPGANQGGSEDLSSDAIGRLDLSAAPDADDSSGR